MILSELVCDQTTKSVLTMKWFKRTAQGFSPGSHGAKYALKAASESRV
jgi:hypothetical protein